MPDNTSKLTKPELDKILILLIQQLIDSEHRATLEQAAKVAEDSELDSRPLIAAAIRALP